MGLTTLTIIVKWLAVLGFVCRLQQHNFFFHMQLVESIESISDAIQFLSTVVSCDDILDKYSFESQTPEDIIVFTLSNEIQVTSKLGSYSGMLLEVIMALNAWFIL